MKEMPLETIFDHNITPQEIESIFHHLDKPFYLSHVAQSGAWADIAILHFIRHDVAGGRFYADKLSSFEQESLYRTLSHMDSLSEISFE